MGRLKCVHSLALHQFSAINFASVCVGERVRGWGYMGGGGGGGEELSYPAVYICIVRQRVLNCAHHNIMLSNEVPLHQAPHRLNNVFSFGV